jgi:flagellar biosynthetic protein FliR
MDIYVTQFIVYLLILVRVLSLITTAPIFGHSSIPNMTKIGLAGFASYLLYPIVSKNMGAIDLRLVPLVIMVLKEAFVGILLGMAMGLIFAGIQYAGEIISFTMGLSMMNIFDPESGQGTSVIGEFLYLFVILVFLTINGHHYVLQAMQLSYHTSPIGTLAFSQPLYEVLMTLTVMLFVFAVKFAAPVMVAAFLMNVTFAIMARMMPAMNVFFVSAPASIGLGMIILMSLSPFVVFVFKKSLFVFEENINALVAAL